MTTRKALAASSLLGLFALAGCSASISSKPTATPTVTQTITVSRTPQSCIDALNYASDFATIMGTEHQAMGEAFTRASQDGDIAAMARALDAAITTAADQVTALTPKINEASTACRAGR